MSRSRRTSRSARIEAGTAAISQRVRTVLETSRSAAGRRIRLDDSNASLLATLLRLALRAQPSELSRQVSS